MIHATGLVDFLELDELGVGMLRLATVGPVIVTDLTEFVGPDEALVDRATIAVATHLTAGVWWTRAGEAAAYKVWVDVEEPPPSATLWLEFGSIGQLSDGRDAIIPHVGDFVLNPDVPVFLPESTEGVPFSSLSLADILVHDVEIFFAEDVSGARVVEELQVTGLREAPVDPYWEMFGTVIQVDDETCTLVLLNEPFVVDDATMYEDGLGGTLLASDLLPGAALVIQVELTSDRTVIVELEQEGIDYAPLFENPTRAVFFGSFVGFAGDLLLTSDPYQPSVAVDAVIIDEETGEDVTNTVGLAGLSGEFVRARILHPSPDQVIPLDLVLQFGINVVVGELEDSQDPTPNGPNSDALFSLDLDPAATDQGLPRLQVTSGESIQLEIYAAELSNVIGLSVVVGFDPNQLEFIGASRDATATANVLGSAALFLPARAEDGTVSYSGTLFSSSDGQPPVGASGSGLLALLEFSTLPGLRRADLLLERVVLNTSAGPETLEPGLLVEVVPVATGIADFNFDGIVEWTDLFMFADAWLDDDFDPVFDLNGDGELNELDFFMFAQQWGQEVDSNTGAAAAAGAKPLAGKDSLREDGLLQLEIARIDDKVVELMLRVDDARVLGYGASVRFDAKAFRLTDISDARSEALITTRNRTLLSFQQPGEVLLVGGSLGGASEGPLARLEFERLLPQAIGNFQIADAALRLSDGAVVRPLQSTGTEINALPEAFSLGSNYPNPFNPSTTIPYRLANDSAVRLEIFDMVGRKVREVMLEENQRAGFYETTWDGSDESGFLVAAGVYFYRLTALPSVTTAGSATGVPPRGEFVEVRKLMLLK